MKEFLTSLRVLLFFTLLTGAIYPVGVYFYARLIVPVESQGSPIYSNGRVIGSELLGQNFKEDRYFWGRPSVTEYAGGSSASSHLSLNSKKLIHFFEAQKKYAMEANNSISPPPQDLLFSSASGLDPHISPAAAMYQAERVAKARNLNILEVKKMIEDTTDSPQYGLLGATRINVLRLNLKLDSFK